WSRPQQVAEALSDARLPSAWWSSMPLARALAATGLDWVSERLALLASSRWDYLPLGDMLPAMALHPMDPTLPGYPEPARTAIVGLGGWHRLRRLTPADLKTPGSSSESVLGSVFREVISRLAAQSEPAAAAAQQPEVTRPVPRGASGTGSFPVAADSSQQSGNGSFTPPPRQGTGPFPAAGPAGSPPASPARTGERPAAACEGTGAFGSRNGHGPTENGALPGDDRRGTGSFPRVAGQAPDGRTTGSFPRVGDGQRPPADGRSTGSFPAVGDGRRGTGSFPAAGYSRSTGSFPAAD